MKKLSVFLCAIVFMFGIIGNVNAALIDRGGGLIYDSDQDITWLQDANYAETFGYDADGRMIWPTAVAWADGLEYYDSVRNVTWDDWRLPTTVDGPWTYGYDGTTTAGYNITTSEMGYMYYVNLGNLGYIAKDGTQPQPGWGLHNTSPFLNLQSYIYWSGTTRSAAPIDAWSFYFYLGDQGYYNKCYNVDVYHAWAVMDGDVGAVPIPGAIWLLGSGLIGIVGLRRKFRKG